MRKSRYLTVGFVLAAFLSCKKTPLPEPVVSEPVFYFNAQLNGTPVYYEAGVQNYYMNSSYFLDTNKVYVLQGELEQRNCTSNCSYAISILINDKKISDPNGNIDVNAAIKPGEYIFNDGDLEPLYYRVVLKPSISESLSDTYKWLYNGNQVNSYSASTVLETKSNFSAEFQYVKGEDGCSKSFVRTFMVGNPFQADVSAEKTGQLNVLQYTFTATAHSGGVAPYKYSWDFGDFSYSSESNPTHTYADPGYREVQLRIIDANNDTCYTNYQVGAFGDPRCDANFKASFFPITNTKGFSAVTILLTDANGIEYSSRKLIQPGSSNFEVLNVENYGTNEHNESTKKIKVKFNCKVQNDAGGSIVITGAEAVMAVSYK